MTEIQTTKRRHTKLQKDHAIAYLLVTGCRLDVTARHLGIPFNTLEAWARTRLGTTSQKSIQQKRAAGDYGPKPELDAWLRNTLKWELLLY